MRSFRALTSRKKTNSPPAGSSSTVPLQAQMVPPPPMPDAAIAVPFNMPPPPTGMSVEETLESSITVPIVMGSNPSLGIGLNSDNIVTSVRASSAAEKAGIKLGDVVLGWQGKPLGSDRLQDVLRPSPVHVLSIARGSALGSTARAPASEQRPASTPRAVPSRHSATQAQ